MPSVQYFQANSTTIPIYPYPLKPFLQSENKPEDKRLLKFFRQEQAEYLSVFGKTDLAMKIEELEPQSLALHFMTKGYNLHELFVAVISRTGSAGVKLISYSMTDFPMRILSSMLTKGIITDLQLILDFTVKRTPALDQFVTTFSPSVRYTDVHSKIIILTNDIWNVVIISSANMTRNNRIENGIVFLGKAYTDNYSNWFKHCYDDAKY
jgi:hypothetical protein